MKVIGYIVGGIVVVLQSVLVYFAGTRAFAVHAVREKMGRPAGLI